MDTLPFSLSTPFTSAGRTRPLFHCPSVYYEFEMTDGSLVAQYWTG